MIDLQNSPFKPLTEGQALCNGRVKISPNGGVLEVMYTSRPVFNWGGFELTYQEDRLGGTAWQEHGSEQSRRRAYKRVFDYAACNEDVFDSFITMTLDPKKIERYDMAQIYPKLKNWLSDRVQRKGLAYILVPEHHKDGAIHFHGLINSSAVQMVDSGKRIWKRGPSYGKHIYNVVDWKYGFTTACKLSGDYSAVCKYITKYVLKQTEGGMIGGRYYYHGGDLKGPSYRYINFTSQPKGTEVKLEEAGLTVVYVTDLSDCQYEEVGEDCQGLGWRFAKQILPDLDSPDGIITP